MQYCTRNPTIKKPELSDPASIIDINDNMDVIDGIICKSNFNGAVDPGAGNDIVDGYSVGSNWWNVTDHRLFVAESVATGAAVWRQIYPADSGWIEVFETWTYASADAPTFTFTVVGDKSTKYSPGMRIKLTQTTVKYFIITGVVYSSPNTMITVYGGTDYTLADEAIIYPYYSSAKAPVGFPLDPTKFPLSADISMNNHKLTDLAAPTASNDAATKAYVDSSGGSGGVEVVTVGPSATNDYVTDGTNDYVEIQQALNDAVDGERVVEVQPADYNFGASGYIDIPNGIKITCPVEPAFGSSGYVSGSKQCAAFRITSTTTTPVIMRGGTVLENIYLVYPNQVDPNNVIVYPPTIIAAKTIQEWDACPITIRGCVAGNAYKFIDFSTVDVLNDVLIEHVKGSVLHTGVKIDNCGHVTRCVDVQFVPEFGRVNTSLPWQQYIGEHLVAFDCGLNLAGYFSECKVWLANTGYKLHDTWWTTMIDCMADLVTHPIILENTDRCRIIGGQFVAGTAADGGASITWSRSAHTAISIDANSDSNVIDNVDVISGGSGVSISLGAFGNMITGCSFNVGRGQTDDWVGAIWDNGVKTISNENVIDFENRDSVQGILINGSDSEHSQFTYRNIAPGASVMYDTGTRTLINGVGRNNGVPGSEGDWAGVVKPGAIVFDNTNQNTYICVNTASGWNPVWKLIN